MQNKLILAGWLGGQIAYLNISREEAIRRYKEEREEEGEPNVKEIEFSDSFEVYDAWSKE